MEPVLEVLVGKTIEQSLEEVMEEEELARLKAQQRAFEELRNNELAEVQRLQEQERRRREEKVGIKLTTKFKFHPFVVIFTPAAGKVHSGPVTSCAADCRKTISSALRVFN